MDSQINSTAISRSFIGRLLIDTWKLSPQGSGDGTSTLLAMDGKGAVQILATFHREPTSYRSKEVLYPGWNTTHAQLIWFSTRDYSQESIAVGAESFTIMKSKA